MVKTFHVEIMKLYEAREQERDRRRFASSLSPRRVRRSTLSIEQFRTQAKYRERPAAADIAFCIAAYADGMSEKRMVRALEDDYLSRDSSSCKRAAYIRLAAQSAQAALVPRVRAGMVLIGMPGIESALLVFRSSTRELALSTSFAPSTQLSSSSCSIAVGPRRALCFTRRRSNQRSWPAW